MKLNIKQAYMAMFKLLDGCYWNTRNDDLGAMLGFMNTEIFEGDEPVDMAVFDTWEDCTSNVTNNKLLSSKQIFCSVIAFLKIYKDEFDFNLQWLIDKLEAEGESEKWAECVGKAYDMH
ncbi:MAG: hypothetical protein FWH04_09470 [Oscillospiraceae bacterium]|nr:hypothetical protein [Oscillospiraceae bacterium]